MKVRKYIYLILIVLCGALGLSCKKIRYKQSDVLVTFINPYLDEPVANAELVVVEKKGESGLLGKAGCEVIARGKTDNNGKVTFSDIYMRKNERYNYFVAVASAWGESKNIPCGSVDGTSYLPKLKLNTKTIYNSGETGYIEVTYTNMSSFGYLTSDTIAYDLYTIKDLKYDQTKEESTHWGGGGYLYNGTTGYPNLFTISPSAYLARNYLLVISRNKNGIHSEEQSIIKVYPNQTKYITVTW